MRSGVRFALAVLVLALPAAASASGSQVWVNSCKHEKYKPSKFVVACGDGSEYLAKAEVVELVEVTDAMAKAACTSTTARPAA